MYSLIVDEISDIATQKQLCVVIRYFSEKGNTIMTSSLGLIALESGISDGIFTALSRFLEVQNLPLRDCVGLATDGCNTMSGKVNSVISRFRSVDPKLAHIRCISHSIQLCTSYALKVIPRSIELMISEMCKWFSHSTCRQQKHNDI